MQGQTARLRGQHDACFALAQHDAAGGNALFHGRQDFFQRTAAEGRVQQHQIELLPAGRQEPRSLADIHPAAVEHAAGLAVAHHDAYGLPVLVQKDAPGRTPAERLNAQLAAAGIQIQHPGPGQVELYDAEHRLLYLREGGAGHIGAGQCFQPAAPGFSCDHAHDVTSLP